MWYNRVVQDLAQIPPFIDYYEKQLIAAKGEIKIAGKVERALSDLPGITEYRFNQLQEVEAVLNYLNIQLRKIRQKHYKKYLEAYPEIMYRPDHIRTDAFDGSRKIGMFFQAEVDRYNPTKDYEDLLARMSKGETIAPEVLAKALEDARQKMEASTDRYLSEDYLFCQNVRKAGMKVWLCPWMHLQHSGTYVFGGKLPALAAIGASATADPELLKKMKSGQPQIAAPAGGAPRMPRGPQVQPVVLNDPNLLKKFKKKTA